jgi:membrane-anchored mycosin MYCP
VLSVGAVDADGAPISKSLAGPWVGVAAPGVGIVGLSPRTGSPVNAYPPPRPGEAGLPFWGTSYSAAYVSGVAALVRAKYPELSARDVIARIVRTAHNPARGADSRVGYGMVDPVAALTFNVQPGGLTAAGARVRVLNPPPAPPSPDHRARHVALGFAAAIAAALLLALGIVRAGRAR